MKKFIITLVVIGVAYGLNHLIFGAFWSNPGMTEAQREQVATEFMQNGSGLTQSEAYCVADVLDNHYDWNEYSEKTTEEEIMTPEIISELQSECNVHYYPEGTPMTALQRDQIADTVAFTDNGLTRDDGYCIADVLAKHFDARKIATEDNPEKLYTPTVTKDFETTCGIGYN